MRSSRPTLEIDHWPILESSGDLVHHYLGFCYATTVLRLDYDVFMFWHGSLGNYSNVSDADLIQHHFHPISYAAVDTTRLESINTILHSNPTW
mmetsp:Transcript_33538/g.70517  ORF Transcript_33538/g.70517 Transcript_33538/m.70517 type:complete len:93 (-) Transcript_33538:328-606(-)